MLKEDKYGEKRENGEMRYKFFLEFELISRNTKQKWSEKIKDKNQWIKRG